jgi:hypothetical protein
MHLFLWSIGVQKRRDRVANPLPLNSQWNLNLEYSVLNHSRSPWDVLPYSECLCLYLHFKLQPLCNNFLSWLFICSFGAKHFFLRIFLYPLTPSNLLGQFIFCFTTHINEIKMNYTQFKDKQLKFQIQVISEEHQLQFSCTE